MANIDIDLAETLELRSTRVSMAATTSTIALTALGTGTADLVVSFTVIAPPSNAVNVWVGGDDIGTSTNGLVLTPGSREDFPAIQFLSAKGTYKYNLSRIYARPATASSATALYINAVVRRRDQPA